MPELEIVAGFLRRRGDVEAVRNVSGKGLPLRRRFRLKTVGAVGAPVDRGVQEGRLAVLHVLSGAGIYRRQRGRSRCRYWQSGGGGCFC